MLGTALDKWQLRALFWQALAAKPGKCGRVPSPGVPFPVTNKEQAGSFWNQQLSSPPPRDGGEVAVNLLYVISWFWGNCQTYCVPLAGLGDKYWAYCVSPAYAGFGSSSGIREGFRGGNMA